LFLAALSEPHVNTRAVCLAALVAFVALGDLVGCGASSDLPQPKLPGATETNVSRNECGDAGADSGEDASACSLDAGDTAAPPCKTGADCQSGRCSSAGFCFP
jgi:hypothetical protein